MLELGIEVRGGCINNPWRDCYSRGVFCDSLDNVCLRAGVLPLVTLVQLVPGC